MTQCLRLAFEKGYRSLFARSKSSIPRRAFRVTISFVLNCFVLAWTQPMARAEDGSLLWTKSYNGTGNFDDSARFIEVDAVGNVVVTGLSVGSGSDYDFVTIKYSPTGVPLWNKRFSSPGSNYDEPKAVALDSRGDVFVTGAGSYSGTGLNWVTLKYSSSGIALWTNRFNGTANGDDQPVALAVDPSGNVLIAGHSVGTGTGYDYVTMKLSSSGAGIWTNRFNGIVGDANASTDTPNGMALDPEGNVYVTGSSFRKDTGYDWVTIKYSANGLPLWTNVFSGVGDGGDQPNAISVDLVGNAYITGFTTGSDSGWDWVTLKYSSTGIPVWTNFLSSPGRADDVPNSLGLDAEGNVFVSGSLVVIPGNSDWATVKYSSAGQSLWTNTFGGSSGILDYPSKVVVDKAGNAYVAGVFYAGQRSDGLVIKYSGDGREIWSNVVSNKANLDDAILALAVDAAGNVYAAGYSAPSFNDADFVTIKYSGPPVPLRFVTVGADFGFTNDLFSLPVTGPVGSNVVISSSANLELWTPVATNLLKDGTWKFQDGSGAASSQRFYKAVLQ